jgi:ACS family hexuronate transporter-like MFS transporter
LMGFTVIGWNALVMTLGAEIVGPGLAGTYMGFAIAIGYVGVVLGPPVFGYLVDVFNYRLAWSALSLNFLFGSAGFSLMYFLQGRKAMRIKET